MFVQNNEAADIANVTLRLSQLKQRQRWLVRVSVLATLVAGAIVAVSFFQEAWVYQLFGLNLQIQQLHIPASFSSQLIESIQPDYLSRLFSWVGWLIIKLFLAFAGAFLFVKVLKKLWFFKQRLQKWTLRIVAWLIGYLLIWAALSYVQYDVKQPIKEATAQLVQYDQSIQQSMLARELNQTQAAVPVKDYLLAQAALLHRPVDKSAAQIYAANLVQAEQHDPKFLSYGLKAEQLWTIQYQVYGKAVTPTTQALQASQRQAGKIASILYIGLMIMAAVVFMMALISYLLAVNVQKRVNRIEI